MHALIAVNEVVDKLFSLKSAIVHVPLSYHEKVSPH